MDYKKLYENLIETRKNRILDENEYYEKHHIIPKCLGGDNSKENLVHLTAREHFIAHKLLFLFETGNNKIKMGYALFRMLRINNKFQKEREFLSKKYEKIKKEVYSFIKGENHPNFGKKMNDDFRKNASLSKMGKKNPMYGKKPWNYGLIKETSKSLQKSSDTFKSNYKKENHPLYNKKRPKETCEKMSNGMKGIPKTEEHKRKLSEINKDKEISKETCEKISKALKGKKQKIIICPYCGKSGGTTMYRWHFENCKFKDKNND